jgi:microcystin-dependent protein
MNYYTGEIIAFAGNYAPENFLLCDGRVVNISQYEALFTLLGTLYGGDGTTTFGLPNLQGNVVVGVGQKAGGQNYVLATKGGANTVTLTQANLPAHTHTLEASTLQATSPSPANNLLATTNSSGYPAGASQPMVYTKPTTTPVIATGIMNANSLTSFGGNQSHANQQPYLTISYIICTNGLYPQSS